METAKQFYLRLNKLNPKECLNIINRLKDKIEKYKNYNSTSNIIKNILDTKDVNFLANCIVKAYEYPTIDDYIKYLISIEDFPALMYISSIVVNQKYVENDIINWNEVLKTTLQKIKEYYNSLYPEDMEIQYIFQLENDNKNINSEAFIINYFGQNILSDESKEKFKNIDSNRFEVLHLYAESGSDIAKKAIEAIMNKLKNKYKEGKVFLNGELEILYEYPMKETEKKKIEELVLSEQQKDDFKKVRDTKINYIDEIGYIIIKWVVVCDASSYCQLLLEPTMNINLVKKKINQIIDEEKEIMNSIMSFNSTQNVLEEEKGKESKKIKEYKKSIFIRIIDNIKKIFNK